ncbi:succinylglutamate desuccinylase/aspartoacylase family protein [Asaia bogorensis]|uniref:succinylglutamate desuccinylase/aspartoacylase domain-containing protein n=1 Tax=Asaia bogorensis TaxID=91915 RepID=UPI000EFC0E3B|nr:succinylglutamate desuccinylase/aspartoacylase family protein [Asaia bogorensis]
MSCGASPRDHHPVRRRRQRLLPSLALPRRLPEFPILIDPPDLSQWRAGNNGIPGVIERESPVPGPEIAVISLIHGNEFAGAAAADRLLREDIRPLCGTLRIVFANMAAFERFDPSNPTASRFIGEDLNRVWSNDRLSQKPGSVEMARAQELLPVIQRSDMLLDLHSMLWDSSPLFISPQTERSITLAGLLSSQADTPFLTLTDLGHVGGARLIEQERFMASGGTGRSVLLEAGQHWRPETVETSARVIRHFVENAGFVHWGSRSEPVAVSRQAMVTDNVVARSASFGFTESYLGGQVIEKAGTVIALDGDDEICTPYDQCVLIMPNLCVRRGQLAVRLARRL